MGANSKIEWTHHTFNIVWGCSKVSEACKNCYAESFAKRTGHDVWGVGSARRVLSDAYWREPLRWDAAAGKAGESQRVFCSSMADVFEDHPTVAEQRERLWPLIESTPNLAWLLLSKRPENMLSMLPSWWLTRRQPNVWLGATVENQARANERIPHLIKTPAAVRFLSCEPLLGPLDLFNCDGPRLDWVIAGGESGPGSRPTRLAWFRALRDQCVSAGVPFHFKQFGDWVEGSHTTVTKGRGAAFPFGEREHYFRIGKKASGRVLDGRTWDEVPL